MSFLGSYVLKSNDCTYKIDEENNPPDNLENNIVTGWIICKDIAKTQLRFDLTRYLTYLHINFDYSRKDCENHLKKTCNMFSFQIDRDNRRYKAEWILALVCTFIELIHDKPHAIDGLVKILTEDINSLFFWNE